MSLTKQKRLLRGTDYKLGKVKDSGTVMKEKIGEFLEYMGSVKKGTKNTIDSYRRDLYKMTDFFEKNGLTDIKKVTATNINSYILYLEKQGKSPSTITRNISSMKTCFHFMLSKGYIEKEPTEMITPPKAEKKEVGVNSISSIEKLLNQPKMKTPIGMRDKAMLEVLYATGMRVSEITDIKVKDLNLNLEYIICNNGKKERIVPFGKNAKIALSKYLKNGRQVLIKDKYCEYLFVNCHGTQLSRQGFWKMLKEYAKVANIKEDITPHSLRHSFGAHLVANGADLKAVKEMMGHSDIASTQVYINVAGANIREIYEKSHPRS